MRLVICILRVYPGRDQLADQIVDGTTPGGTRPRTGRPHPVCVRSSREVKGAQLTEEPGQNGDGRGGKHQSTRPAERAGGQRVERIVDGADAGQLDGFQGVDKAQQHEKDGYPSVSLADQAQERTLKQGAGPVLGQGRGHDVSSETESDVAGDDED